MRKFRMGISALVAAGLLAVLLPNAGAIFISFGDSSYSFGTPVDDDGNQTVCSDGFELIAASTPNDNVADHVIGLGLPTLREEGEIEASPALSVYSDSLVEDYDIFELTVVPSGDGTVFINPDGVLAAPFYGQTSVDIVYSDTYFSLPESDPPTFKPADGVGSTMFVPDTPLPVGEDVVIVTNSYPGFGSHRRVTVIDCAPPVAEIEATIKNNKVKPDRGFRRIRVHVIDNDTFDLAELDDIRLGGGKPFRNHLRRFDVDSDGDLDMTFKVRTRDTDVACGDKSMTFTGTIAGDPFEVELPLTNNC